MSQQYAEYSDNDDDVNDACGGSGPLLVATHGKDRPDSTETRGGKIDNVSRRRNQSRTVRPCEKGKVHERDESKIERRFSDDRLRSKPDLSIVQRSKAAEENVSREQSRLDAFALVIAVIALAMAFYTHFISARYSQPGNPSKIDPGHFADLQEFTKEFSKRLSGVEASLQDLKQITDRIKEFEETLKYLKSDIKENMFDKVSLIMVIMINTVLLVLVIIYLVAIRDTKKHLSGTIQVEQQQINGGERQNPAPYSTAGRILNKVRASPRLERKLCVISFYEETHPLHMRMTQSVTQQLSIQPVEFIIRRHEDILNIPPVFIYFLFVDFNERNVILEDPTLGLGDLRLTTVQAVKKLGGRIVIFYVRDQDSKQLDSTKLYNEDLASVTRQRELSDLNRRSRFVSAYDQLTEFQKEHLSKIVADELMVIN